MNSLCFTDAVRRLFYVTVRAVLGVEPRDVSFLNLLCYCSSATASGSFEELVQIRNGNQEATFHGGSQQLSSGLLDLLRQAGVSVHLNCPVAHIEHDAAGVTVSCQDGRRFRCKRVIVAVPPYHMLQRVQFNPALPYLRRQLMSRSFIGWYADF